MFPPMSSDRVRWLLLAVAAGVLVAHALTYNFVTDDAYISFVFSRNLAEHGELTFNLGHPVEGYTNFLWTVILALGMLLGVDPEISSRVLGLACALGTLYVVFRLTGRALGRPSGWSAVPSLLLACSSGFACWTSGGLETQPFTLLVAIALDGVVDALQRPGAIVRAGIALALSAMTRPEGLLVAAVLGLVHFGTIVGTYRVYRKWPSRVYDLLGALLFLGLWAPWFYWRYQYYGYLWPNTYYVKAAGDWTDPKLALEMYGNGAHYLWVWLNQTRLLYAVPLALLGMVVGKPLTPRFVLAVACLLLSATYLPYVISVGGDFMGLHRFIMPMFVVAAITVTLGLEWLTGAPARDRRVWAGAVALVATSLLVALRVYPIRELARLDLSPWALGAVAGGFAVIALVPDRARTVCAVTMAALLVGTFAFTQYDLTRASLRWGNFANDRGIDTPAFLIVYTEDRAAIGRAMAPCFAPDDFSIVGGAGAQPYLGRMQGIDVFGLVSEKIAHDEPRMRARAGHTKFGSDSLLATYDPTFVFSCYQIHAKPDPQPQLPCAGFWLARGYEHVTMHIPGMRQSGEYYTFLAKKARNFQCPGRVH